MVSRLESLGIVLLLLTVAARVLAAPSSAERETARSLMMDGDRLREAGDRQAALSRYQAAHAIMHVPTTGLPLAQMQAQLGQLVEARATALDVVAIPAREGEPVVFTAARRGASELAIELEPRVCTIEVTVRPANLPYTLQVDDAVLPRAANAVPFKTNPGAHTVSVRAPGYAAQEQKLQLFEGATETLSFELIAEPAPEPTSAAVAPQLVAAQAPDIDPAEGGRVRGYIALGVGGAALAAGISTGILSWMATAHEKRGCTNDGVCDASRAHALARANTLANVANVAVPIGILGVAYGLYELLTLPVSQTDQARRTIQLELTGRGVNLRGEL